MKLYGSLDNRLEENKMYCDKIEVGTGVTMYFYSDRKAYEVTKVFNQKNVMIRKYDVKNVGGPYSNEWELISNPKNKEIELMFRNNSWKRVVRIPMGLTNEMDLANYCYEHGCTLTDKELAKVLAGHSLTKYVKLSAPISFGVADYYYDYSF